MTDWDEARGRLESLCRFLHPNAELGHDARAALAEVDRLQALLKQQAVNWQQREDALAKRLTSRLAQAQALLERARDSMQDQVECSGAIYESIDALDPTKPIGHEMHDVLLAMVTVPGLKDALTATDAADEPTT